MILKNYAKNTVKDFPDIAKTIIILFTHYFWNLFIDYAFGRIKTFIYTILYGWASRARVEHNFSTLFVQSAETLMTRACRRTPLQRGPRR